MGWAVWGSNPGGGEIFHTCPDRSRGSPSLLYNGYQVFPGGKEGPACDVDPSPPSSAIGHERVELYLYAPYGLYGLYRASVPVQGCTLPLPSLYNLVNKANLVHSLFLVYLFSVYLSISTCFGRLCTLYQEKQLYLFDTWYLLFCMDDCLVCRVEWNIPPCKPDSHTVISPDDGYIVTQNM
jgi:hypothetical protein